jgi:hypothetical protein
MAGRVDREGDSVEIRGRDKDDHHGSVVKLAILEVRVRRKFVLRGMIYDEDH